MDKRVLFRLTHTTGFLPFVLADGERPNLSYSSRARRLRRFCHRVIWSGPQVRFQRSSLSDPREPVQINEHRPWLDGSQRLHPYQHVSTLMLAGGNWTSHLSLLVPLRSTPSPIEAAIDALPILATRRAIPTGATGPKLLDVWRDVEPTKYWCRIYWCRRPDGIRSWWI